MNTLRVGMLLTAILLVALRPGVASEGKTLANYVPPTSEIKKVVILHVLGYLEFRTALSTHSLKRVFSDKAVLDASDTTGISSLRRELASQKVVVGSYDDCPSNHVEVRWGIYFYGANGKELLSVGIDHLSPCDVVNDKPMMLNMSLLYFLRRSFAFMN